MFQGGQKQSTSSPRYSSVCTSFWTNSNTFVLHVSFVRATAQRLIENTTAIVREATLKNQQITLRARTNCTKSIHLFTKEKTSLALKEARWDIKEKLQQPVRPSYSRLDSGKRVSEIKKTFLLVLCTVCSGKCRSFYPTTRAMCFSVLPFRCKFASSLREDHALFFLRRPQT